MNVEHLPIERRKLLIAALAAGGAAGLAGCSSSGNTTAATIQQDIANAIAQVQSFVSRACVAWGKIVPVANSVFAVLASVAGAPGATIAAGGSIAISAGSAIANAVCSGPPPTSAAPNGAMLAVTPPTINVDLKNGKSPIPVSFL